ncbi:hypothetical protein [Candidatus Nitrospira bockiana]
MARVRDVRLSARAVGAVEEADERARYHLKEAIRHLAASPLLGKALKIPPPGLRCYEVGRYCLLHRVIGQVLYIISIYQRYKH